MTADASYTIDCDPSTPRFTAAYLRVAGDECAFIETHTSHALPRLLAALDARSLAPEAVRWIVVTHAHLDHAAGASALVRACPNATLLAHPRAARHLKDPAKLVASATSVYGAARFAELYGVIEPIPEHRVRALADGESFALGASTLTVHHTEGHANHHFVIADPALQTVFTGDAFGLVYPALQQGSLFAFPSTSPTNFDPIEARRSIARILALGAEVARPTHFGPVSDLEGVAAQVTALLDRAEGFLDDATRGDETLAEMTARLTVAWRDALVSAARARGIDLGPAELALLALDIELNAQGVAFVADARRTKARQSGSPPVGSLGFHGSEGARSRAADLVENWKLPPSGCAW